MKESALASSSRLGGAVISDRIVASLLEELRTGRYARADRLPAEVDLAAVAAGADGLEVEVHYDPQHAWSDGAQCLTPDAFAQAMAKCRQVAWAIGRDM